MAEEYDYRNCSSLFGYAASVHLRSGGICQYCGAGAGEKVDFDLWRQLTVEHLIGESQGGKRKHIKAAVTARFPNLSEDTRSDLVKRIDEMNTMTACHLCNSMTSQMRNPKDMGELIEETQGDPAEFLMSIEGEIQEVHKRKSREVKRKLGPVRDAFNRFILPGLLKVRGG